MSARLSFDEVLAGDDDGDEPVTPAPPPPAPAKELRNKDKAKPRTPGLPKSVTSREPQGGTTEVRESRTPATPPQRRKKPAAPKTEGPKWAALERKESLLWPDQVSGLTDLRRDLQRRKRAAGGGGERITENTLIRVAVAVLLENGDALTGKDESELRESLSSVLPESRTSEVRE